MKNGYPENYTQLVGAVTAGHFKPDDFRATCSRLAQLGFAGVYFDDLFVCIHAPGNAPARAEMLYQDAYECLTTRPAKDLKAIRSILKEEGLVVQSSHFNQTLPPPGEKPDWIFLCHERLLDIAQMMGLRYVTTHIGWMFGAANPEYTGQTAHDFRGGRLSKAAFFQALKQRYGGVERMIEDSKVIYQHLCSAADKRGITVTMETACGELLEVCGDPKDMIGFFNDAGIDRFGLCIDAGHCQVEQRDPAAMIRGGGEYLVETHFHDNYGDRDAHNPLGEGSLNWPEILQAMIDIDYHGMVTFEQPDHEKNAQYWRHLLKGAP